jgi:threonine/homoserine/homoserine lactone efflux protein
VTITHAFLSFAVIAGLLTVIPGLDTAFVLRTAVAHGRRPAFAAALGIGTGSLVWGMAAATGVSALLTASQTAYLVLRIAGAAYLVWFGGTMLRDALRRRTASAVGDAAAAPIASCAICLDPADAVPVPSRIARSWARGVSTNLLNPKVGVFYVAMLPQFIPAGAPHLAMGAALALLHDAEGMCWFTALILAAHSARRLFASSRVKRAMDAVTGTVLVGFGLRLATSRS